MEAYLSVNPSQCWLSSKLVAHSFEDFVTSILSSPTAEIAVGKARPQHMSLVLNLVHKIIETRCSIMSFGRKCLHIINARVERLIFAMRPRAQIYIKLFLQSSRSENINMCIILTEIKPVIDNNVCINYELVSLRPQVHTTNFLLSLRLWTWPLETLTGCRCLCNI